LVDIVQLAAQLPLALTPHVAGCVSSLHWPLAAQQKPVPHVPSPGPPQAFWHVPLLHVGVWPEHAAHMAPVPHLSFVVPGWHAVPSQHPPLHVRPPEQLVVQTCCALQAWPAGQSPAALQPQVPCTHLPPFVDCAQSMSFVQPHASLTHAVPDADVAHETHCPAGPQLAVVPRQAPESLGGGGGESAGASGVVTTSMPCPSTGVLESFASVGASAPVVESTGPPPSTGTTTSPVCGASSTLPSAASPRPLVLSPHAGARSATRPPISKGSADLRKLTWVE
jgi:hypothetical protein